MKWNGDYSEDKEFMIVREGVRHGNRWYYAYQLLESIHGEGAPYKIITYCDTRKQCKNKVEEIKRRRENGGLQMPKFRKKPIVIEAERFYPQSKPWPKGVQLGRPKPWGKLNKTFPGYWIMTLEGWFEVTAGDWIITGVKGEIYPCKSDIFDLSYEKVGNN